MKNIKVSFHHRNYIYKFKIDLTVADNANMFSIDPLKINQSFHDILGELILIGEEQTVLHSLSLAFKREFLRKCNESLQMRKQIDFLGESVEEQVKYFEYKSPFSVNEYVKKCKQLYIYLIRENDKCQMLKIKLNTVKTYKTFNQIIQAFCSAQNHNKNIYYLFFHCMVSSITRILALDKIENNEKGQAVQVINKILLIQWKKLLKLYDYTHLTSFCELSLNVWHKCLQEHKDRSWIYKKHEQQLINSSTLKILIDMIRPQNNNLKILSEAINFIYALLQKCENVNELLLFVTECINLRISIKLDTLNEALSLMKFNYKNCIYLYLPDDLTEDLGRKVVRVRQKYINEQNWQKQVNLCKVKILELIERFAKFRDGKIHAKKQKEFLAPFKSQRERIRRQSFIMTNFEEIKHKYEEGIYLFDEKNHDYNKIFNENRELLELSKFYQQKIKEKDKTIKQLEQAVAQFVDVRRKYTTHKILKIQSKIAEYKLEVKKNQQNKDHIQRKNEQSPFPTPERKTSNNYILSTPLPPPPPPERSSGSKSLRGSRNAHNFPPLPPLPPPPQLSFLSQLSLPPPPPLPPFSLIPLPISKPYNRKSNEKKQKEIKMINWTSVQISNVKDSFWQSVEEVQFDEADVTKFFAKKQQKIQVPKINTIAFKEKKSLLKPQRAKNIEIILRKTRLKLQQIQQAVNKLDEEILTYTNADSLLNILPNSQQFQLFVSLTINDPQQWSEADKYLCLICKISGYTQLLNALKFKSQFEEISNVYNEKLNSFEIFFKELQHDKFLQTFLSHLLTIGNFMNQDTSKGNVYGFRLESIEKSYMIMGQDKKTSLFEYILQLMINKKYNFPPKKYFTEKKITYLEVLKEDLKELTKECKNVQECLLRSNEDDLRTSQVFLSFYISSREKISLFDTKYNEIYKIFHRVSDFYCEKSTSQKIIKIINDFRGRVLKVLQKKKLI